MFMGDSFCAAHGIENVNDRYSDIVRKKLPVDFLSVNAAFPGADTRIEFREVLNAPRKPDFLVFSYYPNDIQPAGVESGIPLEVRDPYNEMNFISAWMIRHSFFLNYFYWYGPVQSDLGGYKEFLETCYADSLTFSKHRSDLEKVILWSRENGVKLYFVLFPMPDDDKGSDFALAPVREILRRDSVPFFDTTPSILSLPRSERFVNVNDGHPGKKVHAIVADSVFAFMQRNHWTE